MKAYKHGADKLIIEDEKFIGHEIDVDWDKIAKEDPKVLFLAITLGNEQLQNIVFSEETDIFEILATIGNAVSNLLICNNIPKDIVCDFLDELKERTIAEFDKEQ